MKLLYVMLFLIMVYKLAYNLSIPFKLWKKKIINYEDGSTGGVETYLLVDFLIILLSLLLSYFINEEESMFSMLSCVGLFLFPALLIYLISILCISVVGRIRSIGN